MIVSRAGVTARPPSGPAPPSAPAPSARAPRGRGRALAGAGAVALVVAGVGSALALRGGSDAAPPAEDSSPLFTSAVRTVTYEVSGEGAVEEIAYVVGAGNKLATVANPKLPWRKDVTLDVGHAGGAALVNAANSGTGRLTCGVSVDGRPAYQVTGQPETDVSCSTPLAAATATAD